MANRRHDLFATEFREFCTDTVHRAAVSEMIGTHLRRVRRVAEFHSYERMFSLWHIFHLPFFYILVMTALLHVLAVHMY